MDMFVIEMLVVMVESLRLAHRDDKSLGRLIRQNILMVLTDENER